MREVMAFAREHLAEELQLERLAEVAHVSPRQFSRIFRMETGRTPARAVEILRVEAAKIRLDEGDEPVELIAAAVGFGDPERMRRALSDTSASRRRRCEERERLKESITIAKIRIDRDRNSSMERLSADVLSNLMALKALSLYSGDCSTVTFSAGGEWG